MYRSYWGLYLVKLNCEGLKAGSITSDNVYTNMFNFKFIDVISQVVSVMAIF